MTTTPLSDLEKTSLLSLARQDITLAVNRKPLLTLKLEEFTPALQEWGAAFVTLTLHGNLRGCIGALEAYQPLVQDVCEHAVAAALEDFRFQPVKPEEAEQLMIEISRLTQPQALEYGSSRELLDKLRPGIDGVVLRDGGRRATFLPQVWEKLPEPEDFLANLCMKMYAPANLWQRRHLDVLVYQVEEFHE